MSTILGAKFKLLQLLGLVVVISTLFFIIWKIADLQSKPTPTPATLSEITYIIEKANRTRDSIFYANLKPIKDSILFFDKQQINIDSIIEKYYKNKEIHEQQIIAIDNLTNDELFKLWSNRYPR